MNYLESRGDAPVTCLRGGNLYNGSVLTMSGETPLVLIVNHHPEVVLLLEQVVGDLGFESVLIANDSDWQTDGYSALLAYINERRPHAVLFDLPPPYEEAASTVLKLLRESDLHERQWVVLSTSPSSLERIARASGASVLAKPFDLDGLTELLERAVLPEGGEREDESPAAAAG